MATARKLKASPRRVGIHFANEAFGLAKKMIIPVAECFPNSVCRPSSRYFVPARWCQQRNSASARRKLAVRIVVR
jgi:hypothetical protein